MDTMSELIKIDLHRDLLSLRQDAYSADTKIFPFLRPSPFETLARGVLEMANNAIYQRLRRDTDGNS